MQAMGENVAAASAEFCRVLSSPGTSEAPVAAPGVFFDVLGMKMVRCFPHLRSEAHALLIFYVRLLSGT